MRALVVTNMLPTPEQPARGSFVRDQVRALRALDAPDLTVETFDFPPGGYAAAARTLRRRRPARPFDVVHAHFGLTGWPALAAPARARVLTLHGTDVRHPRSRRVTQAVLPFYDLVAGVSEELVREIPPAPRAGHRTTAVLPCGVATDRFRPMPRAEARAALGLDSGGRYLLFPADPARAVKRPDRAKAVARGAGATLLTLGHASPEELPLWVNAADAVLVPSDHEGFGLAVLEALACDVAVLATPTGIHPEALAGIEGALCAPFDEALWTRAARTRLDTPDGRVSGRSRAAEFGADRMALRVLEAWRALTGDSLDSRREAP